MKTGGIITLRACSACAVADFIAASESRPEMLLQAARLALTQADDVGLTDCLRRCAQTSDSPPPNKHPVSLPDELISEKPAGDLGL